MYNRNYEIDMESVAAYLKDAVNKVKTQENPDVLNDIKKTFKKNVPLTLRMYVAAYLAVSVLHAAIFTRTRNFLQCASRANVL